MVEGLERGGARAGGRWKSRVCMVRSLGVVDGIVVGGWVGFVYTGGYAMV